MPNVALFVGFVTATKEERKKYRDTNAPVIVHCRYGKRIKPDELWGRFSSIPTTIHVSSVYTEDDGIVIHLFEGLLM